MIYDFKCHDCDIVFDKEYSMKSVPTRSRCPQCNKLSSRYYGSVGVQFKGNDWHTNKSMERRSRKSKKDNKKAWEVLHESTKRSVEQAKTEDFYKKASVNWDHFQETGQARRLTEQEKKNRQATRDALVKDTENNRIKPKTKK